MKPCEFEALCQREWRPGDKGYGNVIGLHLTEASYNELAMGATLFHGEFQNPVTRSPVAITCVEDVDTVTVDYGPQGTVTRLVAAAAPGQASMDAGGLAAEVEAGHAAILKKIDALRERLAAAERVCLLYGWTTGGDCVEEENALHELWSQWADIVGDGEFLGPAAHPELNDERIAELARKRDLARGQTLEWIRKVEDVPLDSYPG